MRLTAETRRYISNLFFKAAKYQVKFGRVNNCKDSSSGDSNWGICRKIQFFELSQNAAGVIQVQDEI